MTDTPNGNGKSLGSPEDKEFFYSVLNLPTTATDHEIRERHRQLTIIFHPDKQHNEDTKDTATKRFLEVQKAYEVLSNPVSRQAYDLFGTEGLKLLAPSDYTQDVSIDEVRDILKQRKLEADRLRLLKLMRSGGSAQFSLDLSSFIEERDDLKKLSWPRRMADRMAEMPYVRGNVRQTVQTELTPNTTLKLSARSYTARPTIHEGERVAAGSDFVGTIQHQFSPRISFEARASLLLNRPLELKATYDGGSNSFSVKSIFSPAWFLLVPLGSSRKNFIPIFPVTLTLSRRLFPHSNTQGTFTFSTTSSSAVLPALSLSVSSAHPFDYTHESRAPPSASGVARILRPPSRSGLALGVRYYSLGVSLDGVWPGFNVESGMTFAELGVQLKAVGHLGFRGPSTSVVAICSGKNKSADAEVSLSWLGVQLKLGFVYLNHRLELPITLSHEQDPELAFWTTLVPVTVLTLAYHFVLRPLEHKRRMKYFRETRRELRDAQSDLGRQREETISLLQDVAKRRMQGEATVDGLVILEAWYGATERDEYTEGLEIDVTIPLQSLVNKSQLYIPGRRSKAGLQGFRDPVPNVAKSLRVRYTFRGRQHYAEVPDYKRSYYRWKIIL